MKYDEIEKNNIYNDYIINNLTQPQMCEKYNLTKKQLNMRLKFYDIHKEKKQHMPKDDLVRLYITENKTIEEIEQEYKIPYNEIRYLIKIYDIKKDQALIQKCREKNNLEKYGVANTGWLPETQEKIKKTNLEKYGVECVLNNKEIQDKIKKTNLEKYGNIISAKSDIVRNKITESLIEKYGTSNILHLKEIQDKIKKTNLEKYGVEYSAASKEVQDKIKKTNTNKYGSSSVLSNKEIQNKINKTNLEKYGVDNPFASKEIQDKIKETNLKKYGTSNIQQSKKIQDKTRQTNLEKYGVEWTCLSDNCLKTLCKNDSKPNLSFASLLDSLNIEYSREYKIISRSFDFKINNTLVEINPSPTHNSTFGFRNHKPLTKTYHLDKLNLAKENGFRCVHVFDWDDERKIANMFINKEKIYARKCDIKEVSLEDTATFLNEYHLQGNCRGQKIRLGLYYNDELVELMTFGDPRYNKKYEYELLRLCTDNKYSVIGGASKLFSHFIKIYDPESVISYCDNSKFDGSVYKNLGFKLDSFGLPSKHWYSLRNGKHITDNLLRQRGYDQLFGGDYGKGTSNEELMIQNNFVEIYDCGQSVYTYKREE